MPQSFDTVLSPQEEVNFQTWKAKYAPKDSGADYDLRGAFKEGLTPDPKTGHWPDTYKKPNHPTFSIESKYASAAPEKAGHWQGDKYMPAQATDDITKAIDMFKGLPEDRQASLLQRMTPEQKSKILTGLKARSGPAPSMGEMQRQVLASEFEKANPGSTVSRDPSTGEMKMQPGSSAGSRAREIAIGALEPLTGQALLGTLQQGGEALWQMITGQGTSKGQELVEGAVKAPIEPVKEFVAGASSGDYDRMAHGTGGIVSQTLPAVEQAGALAKKGFQAVGGPNAVRETAQNLTSSGSFKTTEPAVTKYNEALKETGLKQSESDLAIAEKNRTAQEQATQKTGEQLSDFEAKEAEKKVGFKEKAADTIKSNREALYAESRNMAVTRSIEEGGKRLGESVKDLDLKLREEANGKYDKVKQAVKDDPGIPTTQIAEFAKQAQSKLKGAPESIRQFNDLLKRGAVAGDAELINGMAPEPGTGIYELLEEQGLLNQGGSLPFDQLQGYSSELGTRLSQGGLPGDVYQAVKFLKEKIDAAKTVVADRNGVGAALRDADSFWHDYQDLFYDRDSAVGKVRESLGVKNPGEAANEFFKGNTDEIAVGKLKKLRSVYAKDASAVADLALQIREARNEASAYRATRQQQMPSAPKPGQRPEPVVTATTPRKTVPGPEPPTAESIVADKRERVEAKGQSLGEISKYDVGAMPVAVAGYMTGHTALGLVPLAAKYGLSFLLKRPSIVEWIARPTAADLIAIEKLPDAVKVQVREGLQQVLDEESAGGRQLQPAGPVRNFMARTAIISRPAAVVGNTNAGVKNRREALEVLGQPTP